jgi:hypothetical protein
MTHTWHWALATGLVLALAAVLSCGEGDGCSINDGEISGQATLPLLPFDLPMYPTDITLENLATSVGHQAEDYINDILPFLDYDVTNSALNTAFGFIEGLVKDASLEILQPGVLSVSIDNQITETIRDYVQVSKVGVNFAVSNDTDAYIALPVEFQLFLGDGALAEDWSPEVLLPFADPRVDEDGRFIVAPGEKIELSIKNVPHLVDALNEAKSIGIGYKSIYRMGDLDNGADLEAFLDKFLLCIIAKLPGIGDWLGALGIGEGDCPTAEELIGWHFTVKKFELVIKANTDLDIPEVPGCTQFADEFSLDLLKDACPQGDDDTGE